MRLFRMGAKWTAVYVLTLIPFGLVFLLQYVGEVLFGDGWSSLVRADTLQEFETLLIPFFIAVFIASIVLQSRDDKASPPRRPLFRIALPAWVILWIVALTAFVASRDDSALLPEEQKHDLAATGCLNSPREASVPLPAQYYVLVYDRRCDTAPTHTVNVSVQDSINPVGPGNALVLEAADSNVSATELTVYANVPPRRESQLPADSDPHAAGAAASLRHELHIDYDARARVLSHHKLVHGLVVTIAADSFRSAIRAP